MSNERNSFASEILPGATPGAVLDTASAREIPGFGVVGPPGLRPGKTTSFCAILLNASPYHQGCRIELARSW